MRLPIDTSRLKFLVVAAAEPLRLFEEGKPREAWAPRTDANGEVLWRVQLVALGEGEAMVPGARITRRRPAASCCRSPPSRTAAPARRGQRLVPATVHARDVAFAGAYMLRYRIRLVRRDRWYVAELNQEGAGR